MRDMSTGACWSTPTRKSLIAIIGLAALFYVSLPAFFGLLVILGVIFYFSK